MLSSITFPWFNAFFKHCEWNNSDSANSSHLLPCESEMHITGHQNFFKTVELSSTKTLINLDQFNVSGMCKQKNAHSQVFFAAIFAFNFFWKSLCWIFISIKSRWESSSNYFTLYLCLHWEKQFNRSSAFPSLLTGFCFQLLLEIFVFEEIKSRF